MPRLTADCCTLTPQPPQANNSNERPSRMRPSGPSAGNTDIGLPALTLEALGLRHGPGGGHGGVGATRVSSGRPSNSSVGGATSTAAALLASHGRSSSTGGGPTPGVSASGVDPAVAGAGGVRSRLPSGVGGGSGAPGGTSPSHGGRVRSQVAQVGGPGCSGVAGKRIGSARRHACEERVQDGTPNESGGGFCQGPKGTATLDAGHRQSPDPHRCAFALDSRQPWRTVRSCCCPPFSPHTQYLAMMEEDLQLDLPGRWAVNMVCGLASQW